MARIEKPDRRPAKMALVLCGGGSRGAIEAGFYLAIEELAIPIGLVVGSSIGALNGARIASGIPAAELVEYWRRLRRSDLAALSFSALLQGLSAEGMLSPRVFRRHLSRILRARRFEDLKIPLVVIATDLMTGRAVELRTGDLHDAIQASCAVPGLFPPVGVHGRQLVDAAVAKNVPVDVALREGATTVLAILCRCCTQLGRPARGLLRVLAQSFAIAMDHSQRAQLERYVRHPRVIILAPEIAPDIGTLDFGSADRLIEEAYAYTRLHLPRLLKRAESVPSGTFQVR